MAKEKASGATAWSVMNCGVSKRFLVPYDVSNSKLYKGMVCPDYWCSLRGKYHRPNRMARCVPSIFMTDKFKEYLYTVSIELERHIWARGSRTQAEARLLKGSYGKWDRLISENLISLDIVLSFIASSFILDFHTTVAYEKYAVWMKGTCYCRYFSIAISEICSSRRSLGERAFFAVLPQMRTW